MPLGRNGAGVERRTASLNVGTLADAGAWEWGDAAEGRDDTTPPERRGESVRWWV